MKKQPIWFAALILFSCQAPTESSEIRNVFEEDQRVAVDDMSYPFTAMGRLSAFDGKWCTAFLVAENLAMTNAHCMTAPLANMTFQLQYHEAAYPAFARVIDARKGTTHQGNRVNDWAFLVLDHDITADGNWFSLDQATTFEAIDPATEDDVRAADTDGPYSMVGYPSDHQDGHDMMVEHGCDVMGRNRDWNYLYHDCDNKTGASGSPIYYLDGQGQAQVVAINSAERFENPDDRTTPADGSAYAHRIANLATSLIQFAGVKEDLQSQYPAGEDRRHTAKKIEICNTTSLAIYAALGFMETAEDLRETVHGWYSVAADSCQTFELNAVGDIFGFAFHWSNARPIASEGWPLRRDREFCVNTINAFALDSDRSCRRNETNHMMQPFGRIIDEDDSTTIINWTISPR